MLSETKLCQKILYKISKLQGEIYGKSESFIMYTTFSRGTSRVLIRFDSTLLSTRPWSHELATFLSRTRMYVDPGHVCRE